MVVAHNTKAFDLQFVLNRVVRMKLMPRLLIMNGQIMSEGRECHMVGESQLPLRNLPEAFSLTAVKSYPHFFKTAENMNYVGPPPGVSYYDVDQMHESGRKELLSWYSTTP